jgi:hypothetical protein
MGAGSDPAGLVRVPAQKGASDRPLYGLRRPHWLAVGLLGTYLRLALS